MRTAEFFFGFESERCNGLGMKLGDFKDGIESEYHDFVRGSYTGLYFSHLSTFLSQH